MAEEHSVPAYHLLGEIPLGGDTGWDYLTIDSAARRLYVTHGTHITVVDIDRDAVVGDIPDTPGVHGFAIDTKRRVGYSSNGGEGKVGVVRLDDLAAIGKIAAGDGPDAILYEPVHEEVYAFNGRGHSATVISVPSQKVAATIPLPGKPEFAAADPATGRLFVNIEDKSQVAVIDQAERKVTGTWSTAPGESPSAMAFDAQHHRLFIGCANRLMVMMDSESGKVLRTAPIGARVDAAVFDDELQLAFTSNGEGSVTIAHEDSPSELRVVQTLATQPSARTMALDRRTHRIYLAAATLQATPAGSAQSPPHRPAMVPGSFKVLVYGDSRPAR
jgi:DNA-binding beta-propeller fold protein YncE